MTLYTVCEMVMYSTRKNPSFLEPQFYRDYKHVRKLLQKYIAVECHSQVWVCSHKVSPSVGKQQFHKSLSAQYYVNISPNAFISVAHRHHPSSSL